MAGMIPGVESARRRRFHQGGSSMSWSRRSSFSLYATGAEPHNFPLRISLSKGGDHGGELGSEAREAKERLDGRLRAQRSSSEISRQSSMSRGGSVGGHDDIRSEFAPADVNIQREVYSSRKTSKRFCWSRLGWKSSEQKECAVCLENFKAGDILVNLPCAHRFHWSCVMPWLEANAHCPCCRMVVDLAPS